MFKISGYGFYLWGWSGHLNTGDDVFLYVVSNQIRKIIPNSTFYLDGDISGKTAPICGVRTAKTLKLKLPFSMRIRRYCFRKASKCFVLSGGTLLPNIQVVNGLLADDFWFQDRREVMAMGLSVGPFESREHEDATARLISNMSFVGFRDEYSFNWASGRNISSRFVKAFDLAVLFPKLIPASPTRDKTRRLGVSLLPWRSQKGLVDVSEDLDFARRFGGVVARVASIEQFEVSFMSLCIDPSSDDRLMASAFSEGFGAGGLELFEHDGDPVRTYEYLQLMSHVVSMRLHGAILSYTAELPFLQLEYHRKCGDFAKTIGLDAAQRFDLEEVDYEMLESRIMNLLGRDRNTVILSLPEAQRLAERNFETIGK